MKDKEYLLLGLLNTAMTFYCKYCASLSVNLILYFSFNILDWSFIQTQTHFSKAS